MDLDLKVSECSLGNADSCFEAAYEYSKSGDQINPILYFEKACNLKDGKSCYALHKIMRKLGQLKGDNANLVKSCEFDFARACFELSHEHFEKRELLVSMNYLEKSCRLDSELACPKYDEKKAYFSRVVRSSEKELSESEQADQKTYLSEINSRITKRIQECEAKKYEVCNEVARDYLFLANVKEARKWAESSCNNNFALGCLTLGEVEQKEAKETFPSFEKACDLENSIGCFRFAQSIEQSNKAKAMSFYRRSCEAAKEPLANACIIYSEYHSKNEILSKKFKERACSIDVSICKK
jgi:TPR repeat protein